MVKFREKWLAALGFAILLHVLFFFIFFINQDEKLINNSSNSKEINTAQRDVKNTDNEYVLVDSNPYITTSEVTQKSRKINNEQKEKLENLKSSPIEDKGKEPLASQKSAENKIDLSTINNLKLQEKNKETGVNSNWKTETFSHENVSSGDMVKKNSNVISRDMPTQKVEVHIDSEYDLIKEELEDVNNEISNAINEVKKHNQQKIDQIQQGYLHEGM